MIDANAYLGHFAFRQLRHNTAPALLAQMDRCGIERAWVSSAAAITYRNAHAGNEELATEVRGHADRLVPFAVLNPAYAGWREDLRICHEEFGAKGLRLYPRWHGYRLASEACIELVQRAAARRMIISIPLRVEDRRQQSWLVDVPDVDLGEISALVGRVPEAQFVIGNGSGFAGSALGQAGAGRPANYAIELSLLTAAVQNELKRLIDALGPERILFGTGMPFHYPDPAILKVKILDVDASAKERILRGNAARLLAATGGSPIAK